MHYSAISRALTCRDRMFDGGAVSAPGDIAHPNDRVRNGLSAQGVADQAFDSDVCQSDEVQQRPLVVRPQLG